MIVFITVIILITCVVLGFFVLVQNPKGGGLNGSFGSMGNQIMGVKQSGDIMEKGTWVTMGIIAGLSILSVLFFTRAERVNAPIKAPTQQQSTSPQQAPQQPATPGK